MNIVADPIVVDNVSTEAVCYVAVLIDDVDLPRSERCTSEICALDTPTSAWFSTKTALCGDARR